MTVVLVVGLARPGLQLDGTLRHAESVDLEHLGDALDPILHDPLDTGLEGLCRRRAGDAGAHQFDGDDTDGDDGDKVEGEEKTGEVVSLDNFRKNR